MKHDAKIQVLFMDDEPHVIPHYIAHAKKSGFRVMIAQTEAEAMELLLEGSIDVAILDANLLKGAEIDRIKAAQASVGDPIFVSEEGAGLRVAAWIRDNLHETRTIVLTSELTDPVDKINGLDCGADDYVIKGLPAEELISRINALLRRLKPRPTRISFGQFELDENNRALHTTGGLSTSLTLAEVTLLKVLATPPLSPKSRPDLYRSVFSKEQPTDYDRSIDNLVSKIRRKVRNDLGAEVPVRTVYGGGYRIEL